MKLELKNAIRWTVEYIQYLEDLLEMDVPIHEVSDFKNEEDVKKELKELHLTLNELKQQLKQDETKTKH